ncbi:MAG: hypothetical protein M1838_004551 [Thelocarpon superellum]|nr:MAG: hypothetical protein M1838_004551 [Thelocarpon superellum]
MAKNREAEECILATPDPDQCQDQAATGSALPINESTTKSADAGNGKTTIGNTADLADPGTPAAPAAPADQCSTSCSHMHNCTSGGCFCQARRRKHKYIGDYFFLGICTTITTQVAGAMSNPKRDQMPLLCPCNQTYVSGQCCFELSGLVYEPPEMKMGELGS